MSGSGSYIKEVKNTFWIILFRIIRLGLSFFVSILTARYLGPERYGITYYAVSLAGFFVPVALLGLNDTLIRELSESPDREGEILGTSLIMSSVPSVLSSAVMVFLAFLLNRNDSVTVWFCGLYSLSLLFQNYELLTCWFQRRFQSKYPSAAVVLAFVVSSAYRVYLLVTQKEILWFAMTTVIDYAIMSLILFICYRMLDGPKLSFSVQTGKELLDRSKYYILTSIIVASFSTVDKIMLKAIVGEI
ncbi:MAG: oligosaccharide flippase family protein, partial [Oscillospiraceae bacterium]|nr:oligosaccharide flippase family protein [Oscillospiraceae bacterium]